MINLSHPKIDESLLIQENENLIRPLNHKLCKELTCVFCYVTLFLPSFVMIYLEIMNQEFSNSNSTTDMGLNR